MGGAERLADAGADGLAAALTEAYEEAGLVGEPLLDEPVGSYRYKKVLRSGLEANLRVSVFAVGVAALLDDWPERAERTVQWFSPAEAAASVAEPALAKLLRRLPRILARTGSIEQLAKPRTPPPSAS